METPLNKLLKHFYELGKATLCVARPFSYDSFNSERENGFSRQRATPFVKFHCRHEDAKILMRASNHLASVKVSFIVRYRRTRDNKKNTKKKISKMKETKSEGRSKARENKKKWKITKRKDEKWMESSNKWDDVLMAAIINGDN